MSILRTGESSIILCSSKILKLVSIDYPLRAIAIDWLTVVHIWQWMPTTTNSSFLYLSWVLWQPSGWSCNKTKFPSGISSDFDLIFQCSSAYSVKCFLMPTCLWPAPIHTVVVSMNLSRQTHYNCTGTTKTSYHKVFEPCNQT